MIGSSNIDQPSFFLNHEANLLVKDRRFVQHVKKIVTGWIADGEELEDVKWAKRGRWRKFKEWLALQAYRIWFGKR
jgi:phosphatidylserine/phosphatidylglycerophosphate/cardiolipin synthase-like enzyme